MKNEQEHMDEGLFLKVIENKASKEEQDLLSTWIDASPRNADTFRKFKKLVQLTSYNPNSLTKNWESVLNKVNSEKEVPNYIELPATTKTLKLRPKLKNVIKVAALLIVLLSIPILLKIVVFAPEQLTISGNDLNPQDPYQLSDGSLVYLNKNSEITFSKKFGTKNRKVKLKGEAFFEVERNENIPFVISTYKTTVKVLGTEFNIYSDKSEQVKVSVISGLVEFYSKKNQDRIKLKAGDKAIYSPDIARVAKDESIEPNFLSWKTGVLNFTETPLNEVFDLLQKQYSRVFAIETAQTELPLLTTTIDNMSVEAVLEELNLLLNTKNEIRNDTIYFKF